jgi:DDE_Tnp_1-associated/Transposase DDE domain
MPESAAAMLGTGGSGTRTDAWWDSPKQLVLPVVAEVAPAPGSLPSLAAALAAVPEHRRPRGFKAHQPPYPLVPMLLLLVVGVLCGRRGYQSIADWARGCAAASPEVLDALGFESGRSPRTPSGRTVFRFVRDLRARAFQEALQGWLVSTATVLRLTLPGSEQRQVPEDQIVIDGKTVRGAAARRGDDAEAGLHLVSAYAPALVAVLDQLETVGKGQEMAAAQLLLGLLPLKGRLVTADALHTQREFCQTVLDGEGDYLLPVKENQPTLLADLEAVFSPAAAEPGGKRAGAARG